MTRAHGPRGIGSPLASGSTVFLHNLSTSTSYRLCISASRGSSRCTGIHALSPALEIFFQFQLAMFHFPGIAAGSEEIALLIIFSGRIRIAKYPRRQATGKEEASNDVRICGSNNCFSLNLNYRERANSWKTSISLSLSLKFKRFSRAIQDSIDFISCFFAGSPLYNPRYPVFLRTSLLYGQRH